MFKILFINFFIINLDSCVFQLDLVICAHKTPKYFENLIKLFFSKIGISPH